MTYPLEILLAKIKIMYYPIHTKRFKKAYRFATTFFIFSVVLLASTINVFAVDLMNAPAEEYHIRGYEAQQNSNFEQALSYYTKAISLGLNTPNIYNDIGVVYEQIGVFSRAEESYLKASEIDPNYLPSYTNLAYFYKDRGYTQRAIYFFKERFKRAEDGDPWKDRVLEELYKIDPKIQEEIVKYEAEKLTEQVVADANAEFKLMVMRSEKHFQNGQRYLEQNDYDAAITEFNRALINTPDNPKILKIHERAVYEREMNIIRERLDRAKQMLDLQDLESAKKEFQEILATIPGKVIHKPE